MPALDIMKQEPRAASRTVTVTPSRSVREKVQGGTGRQLPVRILTLAQPSWEDVLVAAGLDRESRELSAAESRLLDLE